MVLVGSDQRAASQQRSSVIWVMPALQDFISFAILVVVLIFMPSGLMGLVKQARR